MKIIALSQERPEATREDFQPYLEAESRAVWDLHLQGILREIHFRTDRKSAALILECNSVDEAEDALATLPLVREQLISFDVIPLRPYDGYAKLFRDGS